MQQRHTKLPSQTSPTTMKSLPESSFPSIVPLHVKRLQRKVEEVPPSENPPICLNAESSQSLQLLPERPHEVNEAVVEEKERDVRSGVRGAHVAT